MTDKEKLEAIRAEIHRLVEIRGYDMEMANDLFAFMDSLPNEPVSEDLEKELSAYVNSKEYTNSIGTSGLLLIARHFANWQKQQDQENIELAEDHAMLAGMEKMKEQMMAKAINAQCFGFQGAALFSFRLPVDNYLVGSEEKVIVIKED